MFALEIDFHDGVSPPEVIFVRRPNAIVGTGEYAHVQIDGSGVQLNEIRLIRGLGSEIRCEPVIRSATDQFSPLLLGNYQGDVELNLGEVTIHVTSLDTDLKAKVGESVDRAALRVLRRALTSDLARFPALSVQGAMPLFISFSPDEPLIIGRSRKCLLRLDSADVSAEHARVGFENGQFWVEDLGSTNGTFIENTRIQGRTFLEPGQKFRVGSEFYLLGLNSESDLMNISDEKVAQLSSISEQTYPAIISTSDLVRPQRVALREGRKLSIGRDPANDIWVGSAHISRTHAEIGLSAEGQPSVCDLSSNGTFLNNKRLKRGEVVQLPTKLTLVSLGQGVGLHLCFSSADESNVVNIDPVREEVVETKAIPAVGETVTVASISESQVASAMQASSKRADSVFERLAKRSGNRTLPTANKKLPVDGSIEDVISEDRSLIRRFGIVAVSMALLIILMFIVFTAIMVSQV